MQGEGRRTNIGITYNNKSATKSLNDFIEELDYSDVASGGSDEASLTLDNQDMRFLRKWKPLKGAKVSFTFKMNDWDKEGIAKSFKTGKLVVDDLSAQGGDGQGSTFTMKAVSAPVKSGFKDTERQKTYKNATVKTIASKIAKRAGIALHYEAGNIKIKEIEQSKESDASFLQGICDDYGLGFKIFNDKIVIFDEEKYEKKAPIVTLCRTAASKKVDGNKNLGTVIGWSWNTTMQRTYTGATVTYTDSSSNKKHKAKVGKKGRQLKLNVSAFSKNDAKLKAKAALRNENKKRTTVTVSIQPDPRLIATDTVKLYGFGKASGKYYIDEVKHSISRSDGYTMELTMHKVPTSSSGSGTAVGGGIEDTDPTRGGGGA